MDELKGVMLSEINHRKEKLYNVIYMWNLNKTNSPPQKKPPKSDLW